MGKSTASKIYLAVWRWHFWAGLVTAPFLIALSLTGAIYVFKQELEPLLYPDLYHVNPNSDVATFDEARDAARAALPDFDHFFLSLPVKRDHSWFLAAQKRDPSGGREFRWIFYDPYAKQVLGHRSNDEGFFEIVLNIHRTLLAGSWGRTLTEVATCWAIISILAGLYLWWPRKKEKVWGVWIPRFRGSARVLLRDWHSVPAMYLSIFVLFILLSGLFFTQYWGKAFQAVNLFSGGIPSYYLDPPKSKLPDPNVAPQESISLEQVHAAAASAIDLSHGYFSLEIPPPGTEEPFKLTTNFAMPLRKPSIVFIDQYNGDVLYADTFANFPLGAKISLLAYPIHVGSIFGTATKILAVISCLLIIVMSITGVWMWWRRRPPGKIGSPKKPPKKTVPHWIAWLTVFLAIFLPTVGITLILIGVTSWLTGKFKKPVAETGLS